MISRACRGLAAVALAVTSLVPFANTQVLAAEQQPNLSTSQYTIIPGSGRALVVVNERLQNDGKQVATLDWGPIYVEDLASRIRVQTDQGAVTFDQTDLPGPWRRIDVHVPKVPAGATRSLRVSYLLRGGAPLSPFPWRMGKAYTYLCLTGQPADRGLVNVKLSRQFDATFSGAPMAQDENATAGTYASGVVDDPGDQFSCVQGTIADDFQTMTFDGPDRRPFELEAWPENAQWLQPAKEFASRKLPELRKIIGYAVPGTEPVVVREAPDPGTVPGFAAAHDDPNVVQLSERLQDANIGHELAHAWFGAGQFPNSWAREGLAMWAASQLPGAQACTEPAGGGSGADLADWQVIRPTSPQDVDARIKLQQQTACWVVASVADRMGPEHMQAVLGSMLNGEQKYVGSGEPGKAISTVVDWQEWLDAIDERGLVPAGDADLDFAQSLLATVGAVDDPDLLKARSEARAAYHALLERSAPLAAPAVVREAMDEWRFDDAQAGMVVAGDVLSALTQGTDLLPEAELVAILQPRYEGAATLPDLEAVKTEAAALRDSADQVVGPLTQLRSGAQAYGWTVPDIIEQAVVAGRFVEARAAIDPALEAVQGLQAAEEALPGSDLHSLLRSRFESATSVDGLTELATSVNDLRDLAQAAGMEFGALDSERGDWALPIAVTGPLERGQVSQAYSAIRDARTAVQAVAQARAALPEADIAAVVRPAFEAAATAEAINTVAKQASDMRDAAVATGTALEKLRSSIGDWNLPPVFTASLASRDFGLAQKVITEGQDWVDAAHEADALLPVLSALDAQRTDFEGATSLQDVEAGRKVAVQQLQSAQTVADALRRKNDSRDLLTQIGLIGVDLSDEEAAAIGAARDGDVAAATSAAATINAAITGAERSGGLRLAGVVFFGVAVFGVLGLWLFFRRERKPPWARQGRPPWARKPGGGGRLRR